MKTGVYDLNTVNVGDIIVIERYHTGTQLANYLYKRPWRVQYVYDTGENQRLDVFGMNLNDTNRTVGRLTSIT